MLKNKKGQTGTLQALAISLLVIGIVLGFGILMIREIGLVMTDQTATVNNETITPINNTIVWLANNQSATGCWDEFSVSEILNITSSPGDTNASIIASGNYTFGSVGTITQKITSENAGDSWSVTYSYKYDDSTECAGVRDTITSVATIPGWLIIIVIIAIVGILLALVFRYLPRGAVGGVAEI